MAGSSTVVSSHHPRHSSPELPDQTCQRSCVSWSRGRTECRKPVASPLWRGSDHGPTRVVYSRKRSTASVPCDQVKRHGHFVDLAGCCGPSSRWMRSGLPGQASQRTSRGTLRVAWRSSRATMMTSSDGPMTGRISGIRLIGTAPTAPRPRRRSWLGGGTRGSLRSRRVQLAVSSELPEPMQGHAGVGHHLACPA